MISWYPYLLQLVIWSDKYDIHACLGKILIFTLGKYMKYLTNTETRPLLYVEGTGRYMVTMQRYESPLNMNNYQFHINRHKGYLLESFYFWQGCWLSGRKYLHVARFISKLFLCASLHSKYRGCSWTFQKWSLFLGHSSQSGIYRLHQESIYQLETWLFILARGRLWWWCLHCVNFFWSDGLSA